MTILYTKQTMVREVADIYCQGRIVSCLEGGYHLEALAQWVDADLRMLAQA